MSHKYFICGIGGSGMLPLAVILKGMGHEVAGSDRSFDQGRTPEKFIWLENQGIKLFPQDGSGVTTDLTSVVISKAVEGQVPDIVRAKDKNIPVLLRSDVLISLFNKGRTRIAVSGTSGKTTTTGMIGFLLREAGLDPTVMNGGIFLNYAATNPYSTAFVGNGGVFVSEIDESDGIEAVCSYEPDIAVIHNISLDHQPMEELRKMFSGFMAKAGAIVLNADDLRVGELAETYTGQKIFYGTSPRADVRADNVTIRPDGLSADITVGEEKSILRLAVPGRHNLSNALAAIAVGIALALPLTNILEILSRFTGIRRRMEIIGHKSGILVMDDFAHNPDKIAATLATLNEFPGRLLVFFQPHGFGFLKLLWKELAETFAECMKAEDQLYLTEPFYAGGTVDRSIGAEHLADEIQRLGRSVSLYESRQDVKAAILADAATGDRIVIMGARDDTLTLFAQDILNTLP